MQWWNNFVHWFYSEDGWRVISGAIIPFIAIVVAGLVAALIGRASIGRLLSEQNRQQKAAAVTALIGAARRAAVWNSLSSQERSHVDQQASEAEVAVRLLPIAGASVAADWSAHQIAEMKRNSGTFSFQAEQDLVDYRDRLIEWQNKPKRARKLFAQDLATWKYDDGSAERDLQDKQIQWQEAQRTETTEAPTTVLPSSSVAQPFTPQPTTTAPVTAPTALTPATDESLFARPVTASTVRQRIAPTDTDEEKIAP